MTSYPCKGVGEPYRTAHHWTAWTITRCQVQRPYCVHCGAIKWDENLILDARALHTDLNHVWMEATLGSCWEDDKDFAAHPDHPCAVFHNKKHVCYKCALCGALDGVRGDVKLL
jgi:hypothetical protein